MQEAAVLNNIDGLEAGKFYLIQHPDLEEPNIRTQNLFFVRHVGGLHGLVTADMGLPDGNVQERVAIPVEHIIKFIPLPLEDLEASQRPVSERLEMGEKDGRKFRESLRSYFKRYVSKFIASQGVSTLWAANDKK